MSLALERDLNDVLIFLHVARERSFTAAGRALGVPTSTVSRRIQRLERDLGIQLLRRSTRTLSLTDAGEVYRHKAAELVAGLEQTENALADARATPMGRLRVTAPVEHEISLRVVSSFLQRYPEVRVELDLSYQQANIIEEGYDVAITAGSLPNDSLVAHKLNESCPRIVASPSYIERHGMPTSPDALSKHACILFGRARTTSTWILGGKAVPVHGPLVVNHFAAVRDAALEGVGIARVAEVLCKSDIEAGRLVELFEDLPRPTVTLWVTYLPDRHLTPAVRAFVDHVRETFPSMLEDHTHRNTP